MATTEELRAMLAASIENDAAIAAETVATATVTDRAMGEIVDAVSLLMGGNAAGLPVDIGAVLAAAMQRARPVNAEVLATVIAPDAPVAEVRETGARSRRRVDRITDDVASGTVWRGTVARVTGSVRITRRGGKVVYTAMGGAGGEYGAPGPALLAACGNPLGAGRPNRDGVRFATVNAWITLRGTDGRTLGETCPER